MDNPVQKLARLGIVTLAALRATRFFTSDSLGEWTISGPAHEWGVRHEKAILDQAALALEENPGGGEALSDALANYDESNPWSWQAKLAKGLDCPFCVGFWVGALILTGEVLTRTRLLRWARPLWTFGLSVFALNEVVGHVSSRIDG